MAWAGLLPLLVTFAPSALAQSCHDGLGAAEAVVFREHRRWQEAIRAGDLGAGEETLLSLQLDQARDGALRDAALWFDRCGRGLFYPEDIEAGALKGLSRGLGALYPARPELVSVEEIRAGYPAGGPEALLKGLEAEP